MSKKNILIVAILGGALLTGVFVFSRQSAPQRGDHSANSRTPVRSFSHVHGLLFDRADPTQIFIATHYGLFVLSNDTDLYRVGESADDLMGFSAHPKDPSVLFASGHPKRGGNLGVIQSTDAGVTWKKLSDGVDGPVDFHAMTVSPANPDVLFGWQQGALQRSRDGGRSWEIVAREPQRVFQLAADPVDERILYATGLDGLFVSIDAGVTWRALEGLTGIVTALALDPTDPQHLLAFSEAGRGFIRSRDGGKTWQSLPGGVGDAPVLFLARDPSDSTHVVAVTAASAIHKSPDDGATWVKVR